MKAATFALVACLGTVLADERYTAGVEGRVPETHIVADYVLEDGHTGEDLLHHLQGAKPHRRLQEKSALRFGFAFKGTNFDLHVPEALSIFGPGAKVHFQDKNGIRTEDAAQYAIPSFRSKEASLTISENGLHGVVRYGRKFLTVESGDKGRHLKVIEGEEHGELGTCGVHNEHDRSTLEKHAAKHRHRDHDHNHDHDHDHDHDRDHDHDHDHEHGHEDEHNRKLTVDLWDDCYPGATGTRRINLGFAMGSKLYATLGGTESNALSFLQGQASDANIIYEVQLNLVITVYETHILTEYTGVDWDQGDDCPMSLNTHLDYFTAWAKTTAPATVGTEVAVWQSWDDCFPGSGTIGLAWIGVLCGSSPAGANWYNGAGTWQVFAHELGHNFNAQHSFEEGQGSTGGIMDYGDGLLNGEYQFNTQYRKTEICSHLTSVVGSCGAFTTYQAVCGNGIVEGSETCECPDQSTSCTCCTNCQMEAGKECVPSSGECCNDQCMFAARSTDCSAAGGPGFCDRGQCINSECNSWSWTGDFCGINQANECLQRCIYPSGGVCSDMTGLSISGKPANSLTGPSCTLNGVVYGGQCDTGVCVAADPTPAPVVAAPNSDPTPAPVPGPVPAIPTPEPTLQPSEDEIYPPEHLPTMQPSEDEIYPPEHLPTMQPTSAPTSNLPEADLRIRVTIGTGGSLPTSNSDLWELSDTVQETVMNMIEFEDASNVVHSGTKPVDTGSNTAALDVTLVVPYEATGLRSRGVSQAAMEDMLDDWVTETIDGLDEDTTSGELSSEFQRLLTAEVEATPGYGGIASTSDVSNYSVSETADGGTTVVSPDDGGTCEECDECDPVPPGAIGAVVGLVLGAIFAAPMLILCTRQKRRDPENPAAPMAPAKSANLI